VGPRTVAKGGQLIVQIGGRFAADMRRDRNFRIAIDAVAGSALAGDLLACDRVADRRFIGMGGPGEQKPAETKKHVRSHLE